jgi:hypothetical protein
MRYSHKYEKLPLHHEYPKITWIDRCQSKFRFYRLQCITAIKDLVKDVWDWIKEKVDETVSQWMKQPDLSMTITTHQGNYWILCMPKNNAYTIIVTYDRPISKSEHRALVNGINRFCDTMERNRKNGV